MAPVFFLLNVISFALGAFNVATLAAIRLSSRQKGLRCLLLPAVPLLVMTFLQVFHYYIVDPGASISSGGWWSAGYETSRILISLGWIAVAYCHYHLNGIQRLQKGRLAAFGVLGLVSWTCLMADLLTPAELNVPVINNIVIVGMLFFAGIKGVLILRYGRDILESSKLAVTLAAVSLMIYPVVALADAFGRSPGFLSADEPVWIQIHPVYYIILNIPITVYLGRVLANRTEEAGPADRVKETGTELSSRLGWGLTPRETEILDLLRKGYSNRDIAEELFLSEATVKTHVSRIYAKADVGSRGQLFATINDFAAPT